MTDLMPGPEMDRAVLSSIDLVIPRDDFSPSTSGADAQAVASWMQWEGYFLNLVGTPALGEAPPMYTAGFSKDADNQEVSRRLWNSLPPAISMAVIEARRGVIRMPKEVM